MATAHEEIDVAADPDTVWAALRDFGAVDTRLAPGFVTACRLDGDGTRVVRFVNGAEVREALVSIDDERRRLAYTVVESALGATHHHASAHVEPRPDGTSRFVWITDVLPDDLAAPIGALMRQGLDAVKAAQEGAAIAR